jgi:hypothetical protein
MTQTASNVVKSLYQPRVHVLDFHARSERFAVMVFHRRAGKTVACINDLVDKALQCPLVMPRYSYIAPFYKQAKMVAWEYLKYYTKDIRAKDPMESELSVQLINGAVVRLYGADNPDALRGTYHDGVILDEYGDMPPRLFGEVIAPALADRKGWVVFIGTPKGSNHFYDVWENSKGDPRWYRKMLKASQSGIIDQEELEMLKNLPGSDEDTFLQEFECDFHVANKGSFYGKQLNDMEELGHMGIYPYEPDRHVITGWDIGFSDDTSIWFAQVHGTNIHIIDFWTGSGYSVDEVLEILRKKPYTYRPFYLPHDAKNKSFQTGKSTRELMMEAGAQSIIVPSLSVQDGISGVRATLPNVYFNIQNPDVREGIAALKMYQKEFDEKRNVFKRQPLHNWASNPADAFRYLSLGINPFTAKHDGKKLVTEKPKTMGKVLNLENLIADREARSTEVRRV